MPYSPRSGRQLIATGGVERSGTEPVDSGPNRFLSPRTGATQPRCFCRPLSGACGDLCRLVPGAASRFAGLAPGYRLPPASRAVRPRQRPDALRRVVDEGIAPGWSAHTDFSRSDPVGPRVLDGGHTPRLKMRDVRAFRVRDVRPSGAGCARRPQAVAPGAQGPAQDVNNTVGPRDIARPPVGLGRTRFCGQSPVIYPPA